MKTFKINRKIWHRAAYSKSSPQLCVQNTGKMCILGQIAMQCGASKEVLQGEIEDLWFLDKKILNKLVKIGIYNKYGYTTPFGVKLININDARIPKLDAERQIIELVNKKKKFRIKFIN